MLQVTGLETSYGHTFIGLLMGAPSLQTVFQPPRPGPGLVDPDSCHKLVVLQGVHPMNLGLEAPVSLDCLSC